MPVSTKPIVPADRTRKVRYAIREIAAMAEELKRQGREMLYLNIGDPIKSDFGTPPHLLEAIHRGLLDGHTGYGPSQGTDRTIAAIERRAAQKGIGNIRQVCVTSGAGEAIELALTSLIDPGDNILTPAPGFPLYGAVMSKLGGELNPYYLDEDNGWQPDVADMEPKINERTRAIVVINPNNPTGSIASEDTLRQVVELAARHDLLILSDEIYDEIVFPGERHVTMASIAGEYPCVTFNGLSKSYLSPGLRMGWAILSGAEAAMGDYTEAYLKMARARMCPNTPVQHSIPAALEGDQSHFDEMLAKVTRRRDMVVERLNALDGFRCVEPKGAFYVFPSFEWPGSDWDFVTGLLQEKGVVTVPGSGFGQRPGSKHFRIVLLPTEAQLERAMDLIDEYVKENR